MKYFIYISALLILSACDGGKEPNSTSEATETSGVEMSNDLPEMHVGMTDGTSREMKELEGKSILVLFQPDCDHCQREAASIEENLEKFQEYQLYFISSAPLALIGQFADTYGLNNAPNVHFGSADVVEIIEQFGSIPTPSLYIYSEEGKLMKAFNGETPIEEILAAM